MGKHFLCMTMSLTNEQIGYLPIDGKVFEFKDDLFLAHRVVSGGYDEKGRWCWDGDHWKREKGFKISSLKTGIGAYVPTNTITRKGAILIFPDYLKTALLKGKSIKDYINEAVKDSGLTPEFDESKEHLIIRDKLLKQSRPQLQNKPIFQLTP